MHSKLLSETGLTLVGDQRLSLEWGAVGYKQGQPYVKPPIVAQTNTRADFLAAVANASLPGTVVLPKGILPLGNTIISVPSGRCLLGHPDGSTIQFKSLYSILGTGPYGKTGKPGYTWGGGIIEIDHQIDVGLINITGLAEDVPFPGIFNEPGYNFVEVKRGQDIYLEGLTAIGCDTGFFLGGLRVTAVNCAVTAVGTKRATQNPCAHYSFCMQGGQSVLVQHATSTEFSFHDFSVGHKSDLIVVDQVTGWNVGLDFHKDNYAAKRILLSNARSDRDGNWYKSGGNSFPGYHNTDGGNCWWNCASKVSGGGWKSLNFAPSFDPKATIVGFQGTEILNPSGLWLERILSPDLEPQSLYEALKAIAQGVPLPPGTPPPPPPPPKFTIGQRVRTTTQVNVRALPKLSSTLLGTQPAAAEAEVLAGPTKDANSVYTYWMLNYDSGVDGWSGENLLVAV